MRKTILAIVVIFILFIWYIIDTVRKGLVRNREEAKREDMTLEELEDKYKKEQVKSKIRSVQQQHKKKQQSIFGDMGKGFQVNKGNGGDIFGFKKR